MQASCAQPKSQLTGPDHVPSLQVSSSAVSMHIDSVPVHSGQLPPVQESPQPFVQSVPHVVGVQQESTTHDPLGQGIDESDPSTHVTRIEPSQ